MHEAKAAGVATPLIYMVNVPESTIIMEYIEGQQMKGLLNKATKDAATPLCGNRRICCLTSQVRLNPWRLNYLQHDTSPTTAESYFVDFGLGEKNIELEAQGVDLHLLKRAMQSTHFMFWEECYPSCPMRLQPSVLGTEMAEKVYEKIREIERRGRYVEERKQ